MADYSVNATQLSAPQGAGAVTVAPVATPSIVPTVLNALGSAADIFSKGLDLKAKDEAKKREADIVGQYVKEQTIINDAVAQGMDAGTAASRSRASANKFFAAYPEYYKEFKAAGDALKGTTELGAVEDEEKQARELRKGEISRAQAAGYQIDTSMPKELIDKQLEAHRVSIKADAEMQRQFSKNAEARAQGTFNAGVAAQEAKTTSIRLINDIAGAQVDAVGGFIANAAAEVKSGKITFEQAQININKEFMKINAAIQSASSVNPELAAPYRSLFADMQKLGMELIDPKKQVENQKAKIDELVNRQKLIMVATPQFAAIAAASELLGANAQIALSAGNALTPAIAAMVKVAPGSPEYVPQVVGNPNVEQDAIKFIKSSLTNMDKYANQPKAKQEAASVINHTLKQMGEQFSKGGTTAVQMKDWAALLASPEYGRFATEGFIDKQAADAANKVFQANYETTIVKGVNQKFDSFLYSQFAGKPGVDPVSIAQAIDIKFSGSGVIFSAKPIPVLDPTEQRSQTAAVKDLNSAQVAINQLIHMGAHLEGSTDYQKYWNERKHVILPGIFPNPTLLKEGQEVDGYIYIGGPYGSPASWRPAQK